MERRENSPLLRLIRRRFKSGVWLARKRKETVVKAKWKDGEEHGETRQLSLTQEKFIAEKGEKYMILNYEFSPIFGRYYPFEPHTYYFPYFEFLLFFSF